jgi:hypothetical protein
MELYRTVRYDAVMAWGYDWDVWPRDTSKPRIALGIATSLEEAKLAVETILGADDSAFNGTIDLPGNLLQCRRGRVPGQYVWLSRAVLIQPRSTAN